MVQTNVRAIFIFITSFFLLFISFTIYFRLLLSHSSFRFFPHHSSSSHLFLFPTHSPRPLQVTVIDVRNRKRLSGWRFIWRLNGRLVSKTPVVPQERVSGSMLTINVTGILPGVGSKTKLVMIRVSSKCNLSLSDTLYTETLFVWRRF